MPTPADNTRSAFIPFAKSRLCRDFASPKRLYAPLVGKMTGCPNRIDLIGFLNVRSSFTFRGGSLLLSRQFGQAKRWVDHYSHIDGFIYPPISQTASLDAKTGRTRRIPKTKRPTLMHQVPASHELRLDGVEDMQEARSALGGFVILCFSYLYGTRLQFWDWWLDGRIPVKSTIDIYVTQSAAESFLTKAIRTWKLLDNHCKLVASNALYLHSKAGAAEWDWERFQLEYIVSDACYYIARVKDGCRASGHGNRFKALCSTYGLKYNSNWIKLFVRLRNELFHEALWDQGQANTARSASSFMAWHHLRRLNHRLIASMFAGKSEYTKSPWWFHGSYEFNV